MKIKGRARTWLNIDILTYSQGEREIDFFLMGIMLIKAVIVSRTYEAKHKYSNYLLLTHI